MFALSLLDEIGWDEAVATTGVVADVEAEEVFVAEAEAGALVGALG